MKNYLCLDIGNVLCKINFDPFYKGMSKHLNLTYEEVSYFLNRVQKIHDLGLTNLEDELRDHFKIKSPVIIEELNELWRDGVLIPDWEVIDVIRNTSTKNNIQVALLSNIGYEHAAYFENNVLNYLPKNIIKYFSCQIGARKPSDIYYQSFLQRYPDFAGALYVDDIRPNLDSGKRFGLKSEYFNLQDYTDGDILNKNKILNIIESNLT